MVCHVLGVHGLESPNQALMMRSLQRKQILPTFRRGALRDAGPVLEYARTSGCVGRLGLRLDGVFKEPSEIIRLGVLKCGEAPPYSMVERGCLRFEVWAQHWKHAGLCDYVKDADTDTCRLVVHDFWCDLAFTAHEVRFHILPALRRIPLRGLHVRSEVARTPSSENSVPETLKPENTRDSLALSLISPEALLSLMNPYLEDQGT